MTAPGAKQKSLTPEQVRFIREVSPVDLDDLQLWIRHGRVGIGQSYRQEVERARKIETERSALTSPNCGGK